MGEMERCRELLAQGLDLCVRARKLDAQERANTYIDASVAGDEWEESGRFADYAERHNIVNPVQPIATKSAAMHLWVQDQFDKDLYEWEQAARRYLQGNKS